jgi:hypothetical protein
MHEVVDAGAKSLVGQFADTGRSKATVDNLSRRSTTEFAAALQRRVFIPHPC